MKALREEINTGRVFMGVELGLFIIVPIIMYFI